VKVVPYDAAWPDRYAAEAARIRGAVGQFVDDIQHIGSTAVPGMAAKPIIDIGVALKDVGAVDALTPRLEGLGYVYRGLLLGIEGHHFFRRGDPREYFLHVFEHGSVMWRERLAFRDYLIGHPEVAAQYGQLKRRLAARYADDREGYTARKAAFVERWTDIAIRAQYGREERGRDR
jgi:GrpB-like predicted nucleotidyltransferase (UPF0157 family)